MRFRYRFESLLKWRQRQEEEAMKEYMEAKNILDLENKKLQAMYASIDSAREECSRLEVEGGDCLSLINQIHDYIHGEEIRIRRHRLKLREFLKNVEDKFEILLASTKERKVMQKLKEHHQADFRELQRDLEQKNVDDLVTMRSRKAREI